MELRARVLSARESERRRVMQEYDVQMAETESLDARAGDYSRRYRDRQVLLRQHGDRACGTELYVVFGFWSQAQKYASPVAVVGRSPPKPFFMRAPIWGR